MGTNRRLLFKGGTADGKVFNYSDPLPNVLVILEFQDGKAIHTDYEKVDQKPLLGQVTYRAVD